jgi:hypothetical protein
VCVGGEVGSVVFGFWTQVLYLLGKWAIIWAMLPALFL